MALEALHWHTPASVLLGLPLLHAEVTPVPLAFTERVSDCTSLPFPFFLRRFRLLLPLPEGFRNIPPYREPFRTVVKPILLCAFLHLTRLTLTDIRLANIEQCLLRPTLSFAKALELDRSTLTLSALPVRALLPTSSNTLIGLSVPVFF